MVNLKKQEELHDETGSGELTTFKTVRTTRNTMSKTGDLK